MKEIIGMLGVAPTVPLPLVQHSKGSREFLRIPSGQATRTTKHKEQHVWRVGLTM